MFQLCRLFELIIINQHSYYFIKGAYIYMNQNFFNVTVFCFLININLSLISSFCTSFLLFVFTSLFSHTGKSKTLQKKKKIREKWKKGKEEEECLLLKKLIRPKTQRPLLWVFLPLSSAWRERQTQATSRQHSLAIFTRKAGRRGFLKNHPPDRDLKNSFLFSFLFIF